MSARRACGIIQLYRSSAYYRSRKDRQDFLRMRIKDLAQSRIGYSYRRLHILLLREGIDVNRKRVYRLYCEEGLTIRTKKKRRHNSSFKRLEVTKYAGIPAAITVLLQNVQRRLKPNRVVPQDNCHGGRFFHRA